ncbi:Translation elongation factor Plysine transferase [Rubellimicrobium mesophilum DSM 19309]|uniref:Translation elongation factor Plysine transferase n=1 Tax=Rubellimicrobium mesophilum DSM 19309 TaxID=442562 RepID=A0A017HI09_9RHOB|nr:EF-P lysine aminoacylase EpmA [Rubellimicrobium mesophilum]EYD73955.1 Translation elongation factor Plysine transferase [Rubellimicrobium mesophilum DSM 19309]
MTDPWWTPARHETRRPLLLARNRLQSALRAWFDDMGFLEADPSALQTSPGNEAHLHAFSTTAIGNDGGTRTLHLHTSPEFALKKLLAAGETRLFSFSHVWRNRERGPLHHPEFTMLEWYRAGDPYDALMQDCAAILRMAAEVAGTPVLRWRDATCDPFAPPERLSVAEAFDIHADVDLLSTIRDDGTTDADLLREQAAAIGLRPSADDTWSDLLAKILTAHVEPNLGHGRPTILDRYPSPEAALARKAPDDPRVAERFELYACGVELANGFGELTDPEEQRRRFIAEMDEKQRVYGERYPLDEDFLSALAHMPPASGIALGFDRLVVLATGAPRIDEVLWAPVP